ATPSTWARGKFSAAAMRDKACGGSHDNRSWVSIKICRRSVGSVPRRASTASTASSTRRAFSVETTDGTNGALCMFPPVFYVTLWELIQEKVSFFCACALSSLSLCEQIIPYMTSGLVIVQKRAKQDAAGHNTRALPAGSLRLLPSRALNLRF